jgi:hypothetical protein
MNGPVTIFMSVLAENLQSLQLKTYFVNNMTSPHYKHWPIEGE